MLWLKSPRALTHLTPRQLRAYYERQMRNFYTDRTTYSNGHVSPSPFEQRHQERTWFIGGRARCRETIAKLKAIRQMLRDGYERKVAKPKGAVGACAVDREEERRQKQPHKGDRR